MLALSDFDHSPGNHGSCQRCSEKVDILKKVEIRHKSKGDATYFINTVGLNCRIDKFGNKFAFQILN